MANFELKFIDAEEPRDFIKVNHCKEEEHKNKLHITGSFEGNYFCISLDKSTAIKFAKTLRTEINKITDTETNE